MTKQTTGTKELVILLWQDSKIVGMVHGNGEIRYFRCKEMRMMDHEQLWDVEGIK